MIDYTGDLLQENNFPLTKLNLPYFLIAESIGKY